MSLAAALPMVGLVSDLRELDGMPYHVQGAKYVDAIATYANCIPVALAPVCSVEAYASIGQHLSGLVFTGSTSNIAPGEYGSTVDMPPYDPSRDRFALPLVRWALDFGLPCLFICRGFQELNVALGGTLEPDIASLGAKVLHHPPSDLSYEARYSPLHEVVLKSDSPLHDVFGAPAFEVNSLHYQGLGKIAEGLTVEAEASDGLPEVVSVRNHPFAIGVQWHPEYRPDLNPCNRRLLEAFGQAVRTHAATRAME